MDCSIKKFPGLRDEKGVALITITLMIVLVTALIAMALSISQVEINLAWTNRRTTQGFHAAEAGAEMAIPIIRDTMDQNAIPTYSSSVVVDSANTTGNASIPDFVEELTTGSGSLADKAKINPDLTITSISGQTVQVDIDYEGPVNLPGSELLDFAISYHRKTGGTGCASGIIYYIDSVASGPMKTQSEVGSAFFNCS